MYKVGDKFIVEIDSKMTNKKGTLYGIKGFSSLVFDENGLEKLDRYSGEECERKGYEKGLSDAWECAKKICLKESAGGIETNILKEIFGTEDYAEMMNFSPQEAMQKLKAWETFQEVKKECDGCPAWDGYDCSRTQDEDCLKKQEIKVGDVIKSCNGNVAVVQYIDSWDMWQCFGKNGHFTLDHDKQRYWKKTGKHIDLNDIFKGLEGEYEKKGKD